MKLLLRCRHVYHQGAFRPLHVAVQNGIITDVSFNIPPKEFDRTFDFGSCYLLPGFADVHVHLREPGFSYKERIKTGTQAAAHGGYTALCAMPNLSPPPDSPGHIELEWARIREDAVVHVYPYATITLGQKGEEPADYAALRPLSVAFSDDGNGVQDDRVMKAAMIGIKKADGLLAAHCEDRSLLRGGYIHDGSYAKAHGHPGICSESEWGQVARDLELVRETGCSYHVCHVSTKESVALIRKAKAEGLPVTCETAPHYLTLCDRDLKEDGRFKMNPPLRSESDRQALIEGLLDGTIDVVATDHAPHAPEEKNKGLKGSLMGITGLECAFPVLYTRLVKTGVIPLQKLIDLMCVRPRERFKLPGGKIEPGYPADLTVVDLQKPYKIDSSGFLSLGKSTPFDGMEVWGETVMTMVDGGIVWQG